jgi:hypothetical protein
MLLTEEAPAVQGPRVESAPDLPGVRLLLHRSELMTAITQVNGPRWSLDHKQFATICGAAQRHTSL